LFTHTVTETLTLNLPHTQDAQFKNATLLDAKAGDELKRL